MRSALAGATGENLQGRVVRDAAGTLILNTGTVILNFAIVLALSRALGATGYGAYAFALAWASVLSVASMLGLNSVVVRNVAAYHATSAWGLMRGLVIWSQRSVAAASCTIAALAVLVGWLVGVGESDFSRAYAIALVLVPLISLTAMRQAAMQGLGRVVLGRTPETTISPLLFLVFLGLAAILLDERISPSWAVSLNVAATFTAFSLGGYLLVRSLPIQVRQAEPVYEGRLWARSALPLLASTGIMALSPQIGTILLGAMEDAAAAGIFNVSLRIAMFTSFLSLAGTYALAPVAARLYATGEVRRLESVLRLASRAVLIVSVLLAIGLLVFARQALEIFGSEFSGGSTALRILVLGELGRVATSYSGLALVMTGNERAATKAITTGVALTAVLTATLIPLWDVDGAAAGLAIGGIVSGVIATVLLWRRLHIFVAGIGPVGLDVGRRRIR